MNGLFSSVEVGRSKGGWGFYFLLRKKAPPTDRPFPFKTRRRFAPPKTRHFVSRMKFRRHRTLRMRCEAQAQASSRRMKGPFELNTGKLNFVSVAPWQAGRFITQMTAPPQGGFQRDAALFDERDHVIRIPRQV